MDTIDGGHVMYVYAQIRLLWLFWLIILYLVALPLQEKDRAALPQPIVGTFRKMRV